MTNCIAREKNYRKGDVLISEEPFAFALKSKLHKERCDHCFRRAQVLKCTGCSFVHYCDRSCQKRGWSIHKYECHNIKRVSPRVVPDAVRLLGRIVIKLNREGASEKSYYTATKFRMFKDLMSHYNDIRKDEKRLEHFTSINATLQEYLNDQLLPNSTELLVIYGKMVINTFNILDGEMQSIGSGLYLAASIIDHSCAPNAVAVFEGTKIYIRALENMPSFNWMNVHICYIELLNLPAVRQKELLSLYYFHCQCSKCKDNEDFNTMTSSLCQNNECRRSIPGGILETTLFCSSCNQTISSETKDKLREVVQFTEEQIQKMSDLAYLDICKMCLDKQKKLFHPMNIYHVKILDLTMESYIALENWEGAFEYGQQLTEPFRIYYGEYHPIRGIFLMKLGKISLLLNHISKAKEYFAEAASILLTTHGSKHPLIMEELKQYVNQC